MSKSVAIIILNLSACCSFGQFEWRVFPPDSVSFYITDDNEFLVKKFDSSYTQGLDTLFFNYRYVTNDSLVSYPCLYHINDTSWMGPRMLIRPNGDNIFWNKNKDTIRIKTLASFSESYKMMEFANGKYWRAEVIGDTSIVVKGGRIEYCVIHQITYFDSNDTILPHVDNYKNIYLGYQFGAVNIMDLYHFPDTASWLDLEGGRSSDGNYDGVEPLLAKTVFDIQKGTELHFLETRQSCGFPGCWDTTYQEKLFCINQQYSPHVDTAWLTDQRIRKTITTDPFASIDSFYTIDTTVQTIIYSAYGFLDSLPRKYFAGAALGVLERDTLDGWSKMRIDSLHYANVPIKELMLEVELDTPQQCLVADTLLPRRKYIYGKGLGAIYEREVYDLRFFERKMVYYQQGLDIWGVPYLFSELSVPANIHLDVLAYPNPVDEMLFIKLPQLAGKFEVDILSTGGQLVYRGSATAGNLSLSVGKWPAGIYILQVKHETGQVMQKVVIK